jgi:hypothetical protein
VLLVGGHEEPELRAAIAKSDAGLDELLSWPGLAYVSYAVGRLERCEAGRIAREGAHVVLPDGVLRWGWARTKEALAAASGIRHWLKNRLDSARASVAILRVADSLHAKFLEPGEAISSLHRLGVLQLCALAQAPGFGVGTSASVADFREVLDRFEGAWAKSEDAKRALLSKGSDPPAPGSEGQALLADAMQQVAYEAERAIEAVCTLEASFIVVPQRTDGRPA